MMRIAVVGLGQIGGSLVLALRRNNDRMSITGIDPSAKRRRLLRSLLNASVSRWDDSIESDLIVVCTHFDLTLRFLNSIGNDRLILDVCSGKEKLVRLANRRKLRFIGGHPMTGNEFSGEKGWRKNLFDAAPFFLCPGKYSSTADRKTVTRFVKKLGARPLITDPRAHDRFVAITSHFPALLSGFLKQISREVPSNFRGPGFRSMTRLANTPEELLDTFQKSNAANILQAAKRVRRMLERLETELQRVLRIAR